MGINRGIYQNGWFASSLSFPPWPASTTTILKVLLVFLEVAFGVVVQAGIAVRRPRINAWRSDRNISAIL